MYESIYQAFAIVRELSEEDGGRHRDKCCRLSSQTLTPNTLPLSLTLTLTLTLTLARCGRLLRLLTSHELLQPSYFSQDALRTMDPHMRAWLGGNSMVANMPTALEPASPGETDETEAAGAGSSHNSGHGSGHDGSRRASGRLSSSSSRWSTTPGSTPGSSPRSSLTSSRRASQHTVS